jgi:ribosomal protein L11 methylase PrmA
MADDVLLGVTVAADELDDITGRAWLAGAIGIAEQAASAQGRVELLVACPPDAQGAVAEALGGDPTRVDSWSPVVKRVSVDFETSTIDLDVPANVFGDGSHPTTAACLAVVSTVVQPGQHVLDVGCGAGLLSVAAARRGATVTALDTWEPAVQITRVNARRAGVGPQVEVELRSIGSDDEADVVFANIGAATLVQLAPAIASATTGPIVLSGLLEHQADGVIAVYDREERGRRTVDGWTTVTLEGDAPG